MTDSFIPFLDYKIAPWNMQDTIGQIERIISEKKTTQHCVLNAYKVFLAHKDRALKEIIRQCGLLQADGVSIVWAARLLGLPRIFRVTGIDLMTELLRESEKKGYRIFFLGATEEVLEKLNAYLRGSHPGLVPAGFQNGYFSPDEYGFVIDRINRSNADILFVAISSPKKEYWLAENIERLNVPFCMGVGGSFDVLAGKAKRAPRWVQAIGLEWLYRWVQEPVRLSHRYIVGNAVFLFLIFRERFRTWSGA